MSTEKIKILLSAYQCGPGMGSVSNLGWQWYSRLAHNQTLAVTLVTHIRNRPALEQNGVKEGVIYIDTEWFAAPLYKFASRLFPKSQHSAFLLASLDYYVYDYQVLKQLKSRSSEWDLIHIPTPVSPKAASRLYKLGLPVILGPWNGGIDKPKNFPEIMRQDAMWLYPLRKLGGTINWLLGGTKYAAKILVANRTTLNSIPAAHRHKCEILLENAVDLDIFIPSVYPPFPSLKNNISLKLIYVGRLVPFKGLSMLLQAMAEVKTALPIKLAILGDGPMREEWQQLAIKLGIEKQIDWFGAVDSECIAQQLSQAHVFCLPSVRESGGAVLLEAMACSRPVLAIAFGGPADLVDEEVGYAIPADGQQVVINELVKNFYSLFQQPEKWQRRGENGRKRAVELYTWPAKIEQAINIYQQLLTKTKKL
jgi:glycosyltransferase involved in cell wall biosynthesis